ncbi:MAG: EI24 domain-containing protein [Paracoccaceae bacterium]
MIFSSFAMALGQIGDPRFRRVLGLGIVLTIALLVAAYAGFLWILDAWLGESITLPGGREILWLDDLLTFSSIFLMLALSIFLMVPVASAITSMFLDEVAQAVEDRHYPTLPPVPGVPFYEAFRDTINFLGVIIAANILALIVYALLPFAAIFIFWALNGYLLGREYFMLAAMRRIGRDAAKALRRKHAGTIWLAGTFMAMPLSIPLINLVIPILGAATFTHIFHALNNRR